MEGISETSLIIALMTSLPHGRLTANVLSFRLIGMGTFTLYSVGLRLKSTLWTPMGGILKTSPIIRIVTVVLRGLALPLQLLPEAKNSRHGDGSNRLTDNINYRLLPFCIGAAFENKRRVDPLFLILPLESDVL